MTSSYGLPRAAADGFKDASNYDAYRPSYPPEAVQSLLEHLKIAGRSGVNVVELGSGTGKFTELLAKRPEEFNVAAVEPHAPMREQLAAKSLENVQIIDGRASSTEVEEGWGDACIVAQAFHWFANEDTLQEVHRVLKPNGVLGMIWNIEDYNKPDVWPATTAWEQHMNELIYSLANDSNPRFRDRKWQDVFLNQVERNPITAIKDSLTGNLPKFSLPLGEERVQWTVRLTPDDLWKRFTTLSQVAILEGADREQARRKFDEILSEPDVERNEKGEVSFHGVTFLAWTDRV